MTTNTTINYLSYHPLEHKPAAYRYCIERMFKLSLNKENQLKEWTTILDTARSNNFPDNILIRLRQQIQQKIERTSPTTGPKSNTKWTTFTYVSPQIRKITNLFRHTKVKIAFKCNNKISQLMKPNTDNNTPYYNKSGIYKLTCNTYKLAYVAQTSRSIKLHFQESTRYIRYNNPQSAYTQHILHNRHEYGPIDHLMTIIRPLKDMTMLTPYEQYFIQTLHQEGQLIPEQSAGEKTPFFSLPLTLPKHHLKKPVKQLPSYSKHSAMLPLSEPCLLQQKVCTFPICLTLHNSPYLLITAFLYTITL